MALLVINHPDRSSDQWMWTPAVGRERRIALQDRSQRFFGTDFSFEDLEESDTDQFDYRLLGEETLEGAACWKIESRPKQKKVSQYSHSHVWVRKDNYVMVQIENFNKDKLVRRAKYSDIQRVQNIWTAHTHRNVRRRTQQPDDSGVRETAVQPSDERRRLHDSGHAPGTLMPLIVFLMLLSQDYSQRGLCGVSRASFYPRVCR